MSANPNVIPMIANDDIDFNRYMHENEPRVKVRPASAWRKDLIRLTEKDASIDIQGAMLPWSKTHTDIRFLPGEISLWQGINGHGKSQLLGQVALGFGAQNVRTCVSSFEMKPIKTLARMMRQAAMCREPSPDFAGRFADWTQGKMWIYDQWGKVEAAKVLAVARYCAEELKIQHFVVDNLMKCIRDEDDYNGQKRFVDDLGTVARDYGIHVHLVHHPKKLSDEYQMPGKMDAGGSGSITNLVDNVFSVWRNKRKEEKPDTFDNNLVPDAVLYCVKQRNGEWEGKVNLWFHQDSLQYTATPARKPMNLLGSLV